MKDESLRALLVEDSEDDALMIIRDLKKGGYHTVYERVETGSAMKKALDEKQWDIILCDYNMPNFSVPSAIAILKELNIDIPIIIVSGTIGEETAVECMRLGAKDYIMKGKYSRLCPAIARELAETDVRKKQKKAEEMLLFIQRAVEGSSDAIGISDAKGKHYYQNKAFTDLLGYTAEELGEAVQQIVFADQDTARHVFETIMNGNSCSKEVEYIRKDGRRLTVLLRADAIKDETGKTIGLLSLSTDITEQKQAEESLSKSERKFSSTFHLNPNAMAISDIVTSKFIDVNEAFTYQTGYSREEIIGKSAEDLQMWVNPDDRKQIINALKEKGEIKGTEVLMRIKNDNIRNVLFSGRFIEIEQDNYLLTFALDITDHKQMENELRASESNFRHSLDESPLGVRISTMEGETIYANKAILDIYEYNSIEELKKTPIKERYTSKSYTEFQERKKKRLKGEFGPPEYEISIIRKNGEIRHLQVIRKQIIWNGKKQAQVIYQDITDRKLAEEKLQQTLDSLKRAVGTTIQVLVSALESRDPYTAGHQLRVADLACAIAGEMGLDQDTIEGIRMAGCIHDIGKLSIPAEILSKPSQLTDLEFSLVKEHSQSGYEMLKNVESPWPLADIVHQHHERINGTGYPKKLKGNEILIEARIMAVADVVEAMGSHRPYRASLGIEKALNEIEKNRGILYDETIANACLKLFREKGYQLL